MMSRRSENGRERAAGDLPAVLLAQALELARDGHPVIPLHTPAPGGCSCGHNECSRVGKHPRGHYGLQHASAAPEQAEAWWNQWPTANVGLRCDGLFVLDVDGTDGAESLERLEHELGPLPPTRAQRTGRGFHRLFAVTNGVQLGNSTQGLGRPAGIDVRTGSRGYVVTAPSLHATGERYRWIDPERPIAPLPPAWLERLHRPEPSPPALAQRPGETGYGRVALRGELERLLRAPVGRRNDLLNETVFRLAQLVAGGQIGETTVVDAAVETALLLGLERDETVATVRSAMRAGRRFPRVPRVRAGERGLSVSSDTPGNSQPAKTVRTLSNQDFPDSAVPRAGWIGRQKSTAGARAKTAQRHWRRRLTRHEKLILAECQELVDEGIASWVEELWTTAELFCLLELEAVELEPVGNPAAPAACEQLALEGV